MKQSLRAKATVTLCTAFAIAVLCCSFCHPFISGAVYDAIPAQSTFTYKAAGLDELLKSPVCRQIDAALGAGNSLEVLLHDNDWAGLAAPSEIALAAVPQLYGGPTTAWAAVTWVGWRSPWLRWKLEHTRSDQLRFLGKHAVWPIWQVEAPGIARGATLTLALTDKLFIVCLSDSPADVLLLLDTYDKRILSVNDRQ
jgi:hypothetical protein